MRILFVSAEVAPVAKVGGLGDVVGTLPKILKQLGHDVRIFMPYYGSLQSKLTIPEQPVWCGYAMFNDFAVYETVLPDSNVPLYLFGHPAFDPDRIYGGEDEPWRFTFFSNGAAEFCWNYWKPEIVHCHDWHTGMIPVWIHQSPDISSIYTIHNLAYQGPWQWYLRKITWCPWYMQGHNVMAAAVQFADQVTTVSPTYAEQIKTAEYGEELEGLLSFISGKTSGILNGIDTESYNPATDSSLSKKFTPDTIEQRAHNKTALQQELGLKADQSVFLMGVVSRLVEQKGMGLLMQILDRFMAYSNSQLVILGTGDRQVETQLWELANRWQGRMSVQLLYSDAIARRIYGGCDVFLMPSKFEPCGISQMLAMRYGCVPIVRRTGGLVDTVSHHDPINEGGTGYCFDRYEPLDLFTCMVKASEGFLYQEKWRQLQRRAMKQNFSWVKSALEYVRIYKQALGHPVELTTEEQEKLATIAS
ncbi:MAG: glycogen synthase GlgA [Cyanobacteria bacterium J06621_8]